MTRVANDVDLRGQELSSSAILRPRQGESAEFVAIVMVIGERPGLSAADSLGLYLTFNPRSGLSNADRNCISNVRPGGLDFVAAATKLLALVGGAFRLGRSGVDLKEEEPAGKLGTKD